MLVSNITLPIILDRPDRQRVKKPKYEKYIDYLCGNGSTTVVEDHEPELNIECDESRTVSVPLW